MQTITKGAKLAIVKGRYVCPICKSKTHQEASPETSAQNLLIWCPKCKNTFCVNIDRGQCSYVSQRP